MEAAEKRHFPTLLTTYVCNGWSVVIAKKAVWGFSRKERR